MLLGSDIYGEHGSGEPNARPSVGFARFACDWQCRTVFDPCIDNSVDEPSLHDAACSEAWQNSCNGEVHD